MSKPEFKLGDSVKVFQLDTIHAATSCGIKLGMTGKVVDIREDGNIIVLLIGAQRPWHFKAHELIIAPAPRRIDITLAPMTEDIDSSENNGGSTDYYKFKEEWSECGDVIEARKMNYNQGNIFKASFCFNIGRHESTDYERELNKIIYFAQRELERVSND